MLRTAGGGAPVSKNGRTARDRVSRWRDDGATPPETTPADRGARRFVWATWAVMALVALAHVARYGRNVPLAEDWLLVAPLTGNEDDLANWLWEPVNEHRLPLPKLVLLGLLKLTGDFRSGMVFNVLALSALALAMIRSVRTLRGGRTRYADAFLPVALLHLGHWPNLVWGWQLQFVLSTTLASAVLLILVGRRSPMGLATAVTAAACLVLLPLTGANGLAFVPGLAVALAWEGVVRWRDRTPGGHGRVAGGVLIGAGVVSVAMAVVYLVTYESQPGKAVAGIRATVTTSLKALAFGLGPAAARSWRLSALVVGTFFVGAAIVIGRRVLRDRGSDRRRALALLLFLGGSAVLALGVGVGRAADPFGEDMPIRYVLLAVPGLCAGYIAWSSYGASDRMGRRMPVLALAAIVVVLPVNTHEGLQWRDYYRSGVDAFEGDVAAGISRVDLARRHRAFLLHWNEPLLATNMKLLSEAGIGPFPAIRENRPALTTVVRTVDDFESGSSPAWSTFASPTSAARISVTSPGATGQYGLRYEYRVEAGGFSGAGHFFDGHADWRGSNGMELAFAGDGGGAQIAVQLLDNPRSRTGRDTAERFVATFEDDVPGWRRVVLPWSAFLRDTGQPSGAPNDGLTLSGVRGYSIMARSGSGVLHIDDVRLLS